MEVRQDQVGHFPQVDDKSFAFSVHRSVRDLKIKIIWKAKHRKFFGFST
jgi:hypothetical protein